MPLYCFKCWECGAKRDVFKPMAKAPTRLLCKSCKGRMSLDYSRLGVQTNAFKPYIEENFTSEPIYVDSPAQRDALCERFGVTYDKADSSIRPKRDRWEDTFESDVMEQLKKDDARRRDGETVPDRGQGGRGRGLLEEIPDFLDRYRVDRKADGGGEGGGE